MQRYKEYMSHIHAPEELIEKTIMKVKEEKEKAEKIIGEEIKAGILERKERNTELNNEFNVKLDNEVNKEVNKEINDEVNKKANNEVNNEVNDKASSKVNSKINDIEIINNGINNIEVFNCDEVGQAIKNVQGEVQGQIQGEVQGKNKVREEFQVQGELQGHGKTQGIIQDDVQGENKDGIKSNEKIIKFKKKKRNKYIFAGISAAAAALIAININISMSSVNYTNVSLDMLKSQGIDNRYKKMSLEDYEKYIGIDLSELANNNEDSIENIEIKAVMDEASSNPDLDEAVFYFSINDEANMILIISKTKMLSPEELLDNKESKIGRYKVHLGENEQSGKLYAGGKIHGVNYFVIGNKIDKKDFEKNLKKYFNYMKPFEG